MGDELKVKSGEEFWDYMEKTSNRVEDWPFWKKGAAGSAKPASASLRDNYPSPAESMSDADIEFRLNRYKLYVKDLETEKLRRAKLSPYEKMADRLHKIVHPRIEDCDYTLSSWRKPTGCRLRFWEAARGLQLGLASTVEQILSVLEVLR